MSIRPKPFADLELITKDVSEAFIWKTHDFPDPIARWNYHPEHEIHLIRESYGKTFVGDYVGEFGPGYLTIVGPNIPHNWVPDLRRGQVFHNRDVVLQFHQNIFESSLNCFPEFQQILPFLRAAERGFEFYGETSIRGAELMESIGRVTGYRRLLLFFQLIHLLAHTSELHPLASVGYKPNLDESEAVLVNKVILHVMENLHSVKMGEVARMGGMSESTFSRFFKKCTGNNFIDFVHKIRVSYACRLLRETSKPITSICYEAGYSNISNFNRHFLSEKGLTPSNFRETMRNSALETWKEDGQVQRPS